MYKRDQIVLVSKRLNIFEVRVREVLDSYEKYILNKLNNGESAKFLNVCWLKNSDSTNDSFETMAYIATEIATELSLSKELVLRILQTYEELIQDEVRKFYVFVIRGVCKIYLSEYSEGEYKLRVSKSQALGSNISARAVGSFKRKVEFYDRENP